MKWGQKKGREWFFQEVEDWNAMTRYIGASKVVNGVNV